MPPYDHCSYAEAEIGFNNYRISLFHLYSIEFEIIYFTATLKFYSDRFGHHSILHTKSGYQVISHRSQTKKYFLFLWSITYYLLPFSSYLIHNSTLLTY